MSRTRPIFWLEGTFLRPQHFQQQDLYHQSQLFDYSSVRDQFFWGVSSFAIAESALSNQIFEVEQCELVFQNGPLVRFPGDASLSRRSFEDSWDTSGKPLSVYIGMKRLIAGRSNVSLAVEKDPADANGSSNLNAGRFYASENPTVTIDLYADSEQEPIAYLDYNLQLFFDNEIDKAVDFDLVKVAEVERSGKEIRLSDDFIPPLVRVEGSTTLVKMMRNLRELLTTRGRDLALYKGAKGLTADEFGAKDMVYLLALNVVNRYIPLLHHFSEQQNIHPWVMYGIVRQIVGELSTFSANIDVFGATLGDANTAAMSKYQHDNLVYCFSTAGEIILRLLDELTAGPDYIAKLHFDDTYYYSELSERIFKGDNKFYLSLHAEQATEELVPVIQGIAKLSSKEHLPILIARSLPGLGLEYLPTPPTILPRHINTIYFELDASGQAWDAIRTGLNIALYIDNPPTEVEFELLVVYGK